MRKNVQKARATLTHKALSKGMIRHRRWRWCMETHLRSIAKAISWRVVATLVTMLLVFLFTGSLVVSSGVGLTELASKIVIYYLHERVWNLVGFGRAKRAK